MQIDYKSKYFATPRKINHSETKNNATNNDSDKFQLGSDKLQSKLETNNHTNNVKPPPSGKENPCFKTDKSTSWTD